MADPKVKKDPADAEEKLKVFDRASRLTAKLPTPPPIVAAAEKTVGRSVGGFVTFIREQGVVGLAVGLVLGTAVSAAVRSFIDNIVMPPLGYILGSAEGLKGVKLYIGRTGAEHKPTYLMTGQFLNDLINFLIIALVIYLVVHVLGFDKLDKKKG